VGDQSLKSPHTLAVSAEISDGSSKVTLQVLVVFPYVFFVTTAKCTTLRRPTGVPPDRPYLLVKKEG
jgi:hypothetical protein